MHLKKEKKKTNEKRKEEKTGQKQGRKNQKIKTNKPEASGIFPKPVGSFLETFVHIWAGP
jgi:hypothetical protein